MHGLVFREFLEFVETVHGPGALEDVIDDARLTSGGAYTRIGDYPHQELLALLSVLSRRCHTTSAKAQQAFGHYLFTRMDKAGLPALQGVHDTAGFLERLDGLLAHEIAKIYPKARVGIRITCWRRGAGRFECEYAAAFPFADILHGAIEAAVRRYREPLRLERNDLSRRAGLRALFVLEPLEGSAEAAHTALGSLHGDRRA